MSYWTAEPRGRARRRVLTAESIAEAVAGLLDREGAAALSMRTVAAELGIAQSSLYGHVRGRDDLLDLALDHALGAELNGFATAAGDDVVELAVGWFEHLVRHRWAAPLVLERTPLGPSYLALADELCRLLLLAGVAVEEVLGRSFALTTLVAGQAIAYGHTGRARADFGYAATSLEGYPQLAAASARFTHGWTDVVRRGVAALAHGG